jgi:hypothetical protein
MKFVSRSFLYTCQYIIKLCERVKTPDLYQSCIVDPRRINQWLSQDLHMEGVGRAKRDRHGRRRQRRRRPCWGWVREGVGPLPEGGITPEKILEI